MSTTSLSTISQTLSEQGMKILGCLVVLIIGLKLVKLITTRISGLKSLDKIDTNLKSFIESAVKFGLYAILVITCCGILGIDTASLIAILASAGVAVGLAMQGALSNVAGGILILFLHPFHVGDYIDAAGASGTVSSINLFSTEIVTVDNKTIIVPNGSLTGSTITNYSSNGKRRVDLDFAVGYAMDTELVKKSITDVAAAHPLVLKNEEIFVRITRQDTGAYIYTLRVWCDTANYWDVAIDMQEQVKQAFEQNNIVVPHAAMDVHMM